MANKKTFKVPISKKRFNEVLKYRKCSIKKLGEEYEKIGRTEKTIRRSLECGEIPPDLLNNIARYLNIHPDYLSGKYDDEAEKIEDSYLKKLFLSHIKPENYPYLLQMQNTIKYPTLFENILIFNSITIEQFKQLPIIERVLFRQEMQVAILKVIANHFSKDSLGKDINEELIYLESFVDDFNPFSYFAELEGINMPEINLSDISDNSTAEFENKYKGL